jgi:hypothetical protein
MKRRGERLPYLLAYPDNRASMDAEQVKGASIKGGAGNCWQVRSNTCEGGKDSIRGDSTEDDAR